MDSNAQQAPVAEQAAPQPTEEAPAVEQAPAPAGEPAAKAEETTVWVLWSEVFGGDRDALLKIIYIYSFSSF